MTIFATGLCVSSALEAAEKLKEDGIDAEIVNIHTIKPIDRELVIASAKKTGKVVTAEEHSVIGGLGSTVAEVLSEEAPTKLLRIGVGTCSENPDRQKNWLRNTDWTEPEFMRR